MGRVGTVRSPLSVSSSSRGHLVAPISRTPTPSRPQGSDLYTCYYIHSSNLSSVITCCPNVVWTRSFAARARARRCSHSLDANARMAISLLLLLYLSTLNKPTPVSRLAISSKRDSAVSATLTELRPGCCGTRTFTFHR